MAFYLSKKNHDEEPKLSVITIFDPAKSCLEDFNILDKTASGRAQILFQISIFYYA
jgi:hypothetical protein